MPQAAIHLQQLQWRVGQRRLLDIAELRIEAGERVALVGPNGAGKSSLLRVLGGFVRASSGAVSVMGQALGPDVRPAPSAQDWRQVRRDVGQVMQGLHLVPRLTALENVVLGALARAPAMPAWRSWTRLYPQDLLDQAQAALHEMGLADRAQVRADRLSGGEKQKVSLARLRLQRPRIILADEPTSALDPRATIEACHALRAMAEGLTLISVVHQMDLLPILADRVVGLSQGRVVLDLPVQQADGPRMAELFAASSTLPEPVALTNP
jgi:phosphonate transport system ATP-binding protein